MSLECCGNPVLFMFSTLEEYFSFVISKVLLDAGRENTFQLISTVHLMINFDSFIKKSKRCFSCWTNFSQNSNLVELSIMVNKLRLCFYRIELLCLLRFSSIVKILKTFWHWSWVADFITAIHFWNLTF